VDVQGNRIEVEVTAWGRDEESWKMEYQVFQGDPAQLNVWKDLDSYIEKTFLHESGIPLRIAVTCVDTGGHHTQMAYNFVKARERQGIYGIKGANKSGEPIWPKRASKKNKGGINLYMIGTDGAKDLIYGRLKITEPGPGYMHFPLQYDQEYFRQLTSEKVIYEKGARKWILKPGIRNEALDLNVYGVAALERLKQSPRFNLNKLADKMITLGKRERTETAPDQAPALQRPPEPEKSAQSRRRVISAGVRKGWVNSWRK
jgi:phage terminase large subunit GpA-like protein